MSEVPQELCKLHSSNMANIREMSDRIARLRPKVITQIPMIYFYPFSSFP